MTKRDYKTWVHKFGLGLYSWLKVLPLYTDSGRVVELPHPVPLVYYPIKDHSRLEAQITEAGFHFAWSTADYLEGYHIPTGYMMKALVKDTA